MNGSPPSKTGEHEVRQRVRGRDTEPVSGCGVQGVGVWVGGGGVSSCAGKRFQSWAEQNPGSESLISDVTAGVLQWALQNVWANWQDFLPIWHIHTEQGISHCSGWSQGKIKFKFSAASSLHATVWLSADAAPYLLPHTPTVLHLSHCPLHSESHRGTSSPWQNTCCDIADCCSTRQHEKRQNKSKAVRKHKHIQKTTDSYKTVELFCLFCLMMHDSNIMYCYLRVKNKMDKNKTLFAHDGHLKFSCPLGTFCRVQLAEFQYLVESSLFNCIFSLDEKDKIFKLVSFCMHVF